MNSLEYLKKFTTIVADTAEIELIKEHRPQDATTNPSLLLKMVGQEQYDYVFKHGQEWAQQINHLENINSEDILYCTVAVSFGLEILKHIPGRISTEVPSRYSFDMDSTIGLAKLIIKLYQEKNIGKEKVLIKIASTWEGIQAAKQLEKEGIHTNLTLLFSLPQAIACAQAGIKLISPFVGRVYDWYKKNVSPDEKNYQGNQDPGVQLVSSIYEYYKKFDYPTEIMGASFRNIGQIIHLSGCDLLTISPNLLEELNNHPLNHPINENQPMLSIDKAKQSNLDKIDLDQKTFLWELNQNAMACEKLAEGIRVFHQDYLKLNQILASK